MNTAVMFSRASDEWSTPPDLFRDLDAEFGFRLDAAATAENALAPRWIDQEMDALTQSWHLQGGPVWINPPYSQCRAFMAKAATEAACGATVVCLVPARVDTRWWHAHVWDRDQHRPRPGVEVRFLRGRLKFGGHANAAPFPSVVIVMRPA